MRAENSPNPLFLLFPAIWIFWGFGYETLGGRLWIEEKGTIIESTDKPSKDAPRYVTEYLIQSAEGKNNLFVSGPADASLPRSMPVGTVIVKKRWHLSYEKNGQLIDDFPLAFYSVIIGIAFGFLFWAFLQWKNQRKYKKVN